MKTLPPVEHVAPKWREVHLSERQWEALLTLARGRGVLTVPERTLQSLWKAGLAARLYREQGGTIAHAGWEVTERGRVRLDMRHEERALGRSPVSTD